MPMPLKGIFSICIFLKPSFLISLKVLYKFAAASFKLEFLAPGFDKENFSITNKDGVLTVSAEVKKEESQANNYTQKRFSIQSFERAFKLPDTVDVEKIAAKYSNGILKVELLKKEVGPEPEIRNIPIM